MDCYAKVLDKIISLGSRPIALNLIPVFGRRYFKWFSKRADPEQLMRFLGTTDSIEHWNEMYNLAVMRVAAERNVPVLDVRSAFLYRRVFDSLFSTDGIHPSVEGHRRMYEFLLPGAYWPERPPHSPLIRRKNSPARFAQNAQGLFSSKMAFEALAPILV